MTTASGQVRADLTAIVDVGHGRSTCRLFHDWSKWTTTERGEMVKGDDRVVGLVEMQRRECRRCGAAGLQQVRA